MNINGMINNINELNGNKMKVNNEINQIDNNNLLYKSNFHIRELTDSEKLLLEKYNNYNKEKSIDYDNINDYSLINKNNEIPSNKDNKIFNDKNYNYTNYNSRELKPLINIYKSNEKNSLTNHSNIPVYCKENHYFSIINKNTAEPPNVQNNRYYNSDNYSFSLIEKDKNNNCDQFLKLESEYSKNYNKISQNDNNNKSFKFKNNFLLKTQKILNIKNIDNNIKKQKNENDTEESLSNKNFSSKNIFSNNKCYLNDKTFNNDINENNFVISNYKSDKNNFPTMPNINNIKFNKISSNNNIFSPKIMKNQKRFIEEKILENSNEEMLNNKDSKVNNFLIPNNNRSTKTSNKKMKSNIIKPYNYITDSIILKINKINKEDNSTIEKEKNKIISPPKSSHKLIKNNSAPKIKTSFDSKNPYLYNSYQVNLNRYTSKKIKLFKYSTILSDLIKKNEKSFF